MNAWVKQQLVSLVSEKSLRQGHFRLPSGKKSNYYVDMSKVSLDSRGAELIAQGLEPELRTLRNKATAIGGPVFGAAPIVSAVLCLPSQPIKHGFLVRRSLKRHGHGGRIEGVLRKGQSVVVVEDVTTSGNSVLWAANFLRDKYDCDIVRIITVLDRLEGAAKLLNENGYEFQSLTTANDLEFTFV